MGVLFFSFFSHLSPLVYPLSWVCPHLPGLVEGAWWTLFIWFPWWTYFEWFKVSLLLLLSHRWMLLWLLRRTFILKVLIGFTLAPPQPQMDVALAPLLHIHTEGPDSPFLGLSDTS